MGELAWDRENFQIAYLMQVFIYVFFPGSYTLKQQKCTQHILFLYLYILSKYAENEWLIREDVGKALREQKYNKI